ncbi:MAG: EAL domain-containing protein [Halofilum sp. (in: g-proteobacteria)]
MPNVVIVDDQATDRHILQRMIHNLADDLTVHAFGHAEQALAWLQEHQPDLILLDYRMPDIDGLAFVGRLNDIPACTGIPVIVITVVDDSELRYRALEAGATDFLTKPLDLQECQARCRNLLTLRRQQLTIARHAETLAEARRRTGRALQMLSAGNELLVGMQSEPELLRGMCRIITEQAGYPLARVGLWDDRERLHEAACVPVGIEGDSIALSGTAFSPLARDLRASGRPRLLNDLAAAEHEATAWARHVYAAGFRSAGVLPIHIEGLVDGVLVVAAGDAEAFDRDETELLQRTATNLGYGLAARRAQRARDRAERECRYLTHFDRLTGLPNRNRLLQRMRELNECDTARPSAAVMVINLDRFKVVNNTIGHEAGDQLLRHAVQRLQTVVRSSDLLARQAGDEFILLIQEFGGDAAHDGTDALAARATRTAQRIIETMRRPIELAGYEYYIGASVGISRMETGADVDLSATLRQADTAMRQAKEAGGNNYAFYQGGLTERHTRRLSLESRLRRAINEEGFVLHYQPIVELGAGRPIGVEALVRWPQEDGSLLAPDAFIPLAEETGLMERLGRLVFEAACRQARAWDDAGLMPYLSVNLSVHQLLLARLPREFEDIMAATGVTPERFELEVTESVMMTDPARTEHIIRELHALGMGIALDDFGIGYSSLSRLKHLPITTLKIDKDFVLGLSSDPSEHTIVRSIVQLAENLRVHAVAEGIETAEQHNVLQTMGCRYGQGFHFSKPLPADRLQQLLIDAGGEGGTDGHGRG